PRGDQRHTAEVLDREVPGGLLEQARDQGNRDPQLLAAADEPQENVAGRRRERDDHLADAMLGRDAVEIPARTQHGQSPGALLRLERLLVEEADRFEAELGLLDQTLRGRAADVPGADDQGGDERLAASARLELP